MKRALALVERDMRKFRRSPALLVSSLVLPLLQLIILGNAFGGNIKNVNLGVVNLDRGPESVDVLERVRAVGANARTFLPSDYDDEGAAVGDLRKGVLGAVLIIPQHYSRDLLEQHQPHLALITDNTDRSVAGAMGEQMSLLVASINAPQVAPREPQQALLDVGIRTAPVRRAPTARTTASPSPAARASTSPAATASPTPAASPSPAARLRALTAIPLAAVIYDPKGRPWTYTIAGPRTYVRKAIVIDRISGDTVLLRSGPPVGTPVVIVGASELLGAEYGVGEE